MSTRGHVRKHGPGWQAIAYLGRDPLTGKAKFARKTHRTKREAHRWLTAVYSKIDRDAFVDPNRTTVAEYMRTWLVRATRDLRPSTIPAYEIAVEKHVIPRIGALPLQKLTPQQLTSLYDELLESGRCNGKGGLSARTVRFTHSIVRKALAEAVDLQLLERNPAETAKPPKVTTTERAARASRRYWTADSVRRFLVHVRTHRLQAAFHLATTTGMRRGEVLGLRWSDVDLDNERLSVVQTLLAPRYVLTLGEPKSERGRRSIDLDEGTVAVLREHRKRQAEERLAFGPGWGEHPLADDLVFRQADGSPVVPHLFSLAFTQAVKNAKLPPIRLHDLRHTHIALLGEAGVPPKVIQERVGHHSAGFTLDNYGGTFPAQHEEAARRFAALLNGKEEAT
jgi:integrase